MTVAGREEAARHRDRQEEAATGDQLFAVDIAAGWARRGGRMLARLVRRHPHHTEERPERELVPELIPADEPVRIELPVERRPGHLVGDAEMLVDRTAPATGIGIAEGSEAKTVDLNLQCHPRLGAANGDRAGQRMAALPRLEEPPRRAILVVRLQPPAGIERLETNGIARIDGEDRRPLAREWTVDRPRRGLNRVGCHRSSS